MKEQEIDQAAEVAGLAKEIFRAFESQLGEVMATQRLAAREASEALADTQIKLSKLLFEARQASDAMRAMQHELSRNWQMHVAENSKAAGRDMALAFGAEIAAGLEQRLEKLAIQAERATRRLTLRAAFPWVMGLAIAIPVIIAIALSALMPRPADPSILGLTADQTHDVLSRIAICAPYKNDMGDLHVCVATDDPPRLIRDPHNKATVIVRGM
ncbi:MAG TPA: hypothetical protein VN730_15640 [Steroidobacteraceae bacterium]|nr:hypothetical protein [Steroidobacteraceae bacterium]